MHIHDWLTNPLWTVRTNSHQSATIQLVNSIKKKKPKILRKKRSNNNIYVITFTEQ